MATHSKAHPLASHPPRSRWDKLLSKLGLQGLGNLPQAVRPPATLGIDGMPEQIAPLPRGLNTALTGPEGEYFWLWRQQVVRSLVESAPLFVLAASHEEMERLLAPSDLQEAYASGRIQAWIWTAESQQQVAARQLPDWLTELHKAGLRSRQAVFCTNASALLQHLDLLQLDRISSQWLHWARQRQQASVWCFPLQIDRPQARHVVSAMGRCFLYAAHLESDLHGNALLLERWDGTHGAIFKSRYGLELSHGTLHSDGSVVRGVQARMSQAPDANVVYATAACLHKLRNLPPHWQSEDDWRSLEKACKAAIGATVLLDNGNLEDFEALAALVHRLRTTHPSTLKIVVLETSVKLRTYHELALRSLGANEVLYKELRFARIIRRIEDLRDHVYTHAVPSDHAPVLLEYLPVAARGYQAPHTFIMMARSMVTQAQRHKLDHALVQLHLLPHVSHLMALRQFCGTRDGDLLTADQHSLWIFLFACREVDVDETLTRLFAMPLNSLFSSQTSYAELSGISTQLSVLTAQEMERPLPDYGRLLVPARSIPRPTAPAEVSAAETRVAAAPLSVQENPVASSASERLSLQWSATPLKRSQPSLPSAQP